METLWHLTTLSTAASDSASDTTDRSIIFIIAASILGLIVVLLVLMQMTAIRRRSTPRRPAENETQLGTDPWSEAARRLSTDDQGDEDS